MNDNLQEERSKNIHLKTIIAVSLVSITIISGLFVNLKILAKDSELKSICNLAKSNFTDVVKKIESKQKDIEKETDKAHEKIVIIKETVNEIDKKDKNDNEVLNKLKVLEEENEKLKEDNLKYQNILKVSASRGTRPRNYRNPPEITSRGGVLKGKYLGEFTVTAYTPSKAECGSDRGITASGSPIVPGITVAVDKNYWPLGTVFYIKGLGYVVAMDTGGAIKGKNRLDFAVFDREFAKRIGRRNFEVYLISVGNGKVKDINFD